MKFACIALASCLCVAQLAAQDPTPAASSVPSDPAKITAAALAAFAHDDLETAKKAFQKLLDLNPNDLTALLNLGTIERRLKHPEAAERHLKKAVRLEPDAAIPWLTLGVIYFEQDKLDAALAALSQAVYLDPKNARAHNYLAVTIGKKGWLSGAEDELQKAIELSPDYADAHFNLAVFYLQRSPPAPELARRHYQKALDLGAAPDKLIEKELEEKTMSDNKPADHAK